MTTTDTMSAVKTGLTISEVIQAWVDGASGDLNSKPSGPNNWYGYRSSYRPSDPSIQAHGGRITSRDELMGLRFRKEEGGELDYWYLLNADGYPAGTAYARHQIEIRRMVGKREHYLIPFSALRAADLSPELLEFLDKRPDSRIQVPVEKCQLWHNDSGSLSWQKCDMTRSQWKLDGGDPDNMDGPHRFFEEQHIMGASLFRAETKSERYTSDQEDWRWDNSRGQYYNSVTGERRDDLFETVTKMRYFLSAIDETGANPNNAYFLTELRFPAFSLDEAYTQLMPLAVVFAGAEGKGVLRQGEWFFIPVDDEMQSFLVNREKELSRLADKYRREGRYWGKEFAETQFKASRLLNPSNEIDWAGHPIRRRSSHFARRLITITDKGQFVRGEVWHLEGDHPRLHFPDKNRWYKAVHNIQVQSWSAGRNGQRARVD